MKRPTVAALALLLLFPFRAASQGADAGRRQAAEDLARLVYAAESGDDIAGTLADIRIQASPELAPYREPLLAWIRNLASWDALGAQMIDLYASQFTEAELRDIMAFYRTPTGQKVLKRVPAMLSGATGVGLALIQNRQGELEEIVHAEIWKEGGEALRTQADRLFDEEKWPEARDAYVRYLEVHPEEVDVISDLGVCYRGAGDSENALKTFDRAIAIKPDHWQSLYNKIIVVGLDLGRKAEARELLAKLRVLQPDNPDIEKLAEAIGEE
jgi:tetratricopeptide (TPR) repeat protein